MQEIWRRRAAEGLAHVASTEPLLAEHFKHPLAHAPGSHSSYSNTGFVVLSAVIEEATGKPYESYCREAVFAPLGIASARLHPDWRQFSGARGWIITAADYLAFLDVFDPKHPFLGDRVKAWIVAAETRWDKRLPRAVRRARHRDRDHARGLAGDAQRHSRISTARVPRVSRSRP